MTALPNSGQSCLIPLICLHRGKVRTASSRDRVLSNPDETCHQVLLARCFSSVLNNVRFF